MVCVGVVDMLRYIEVVHHAGPWDKVEARVVRGDMRKFQVLAQLKLK